MTDVRSARTGGADYRPMTENTLASYLAGFSDVAAILGGAAQDGEWAWAAPCWKRTP